MPSCIEAMRGALLGLHRGELSMPLHRGGERPLFSLKEIVFAPANSARGLDTHQGAVLLHDGADGRLVAILNASAITAIRTAAVSGLASSILARRNARRVAILGSGVQGRSHAVAMRAVFPDAELRIWSPNPARAEALASEAHGVTARSIGDALQGADVRS